ncbi:MAG TPA: hypothetical protein VMJ10_15745 [Kofleriaceae bacterium]|nr:hypothetical protein [Kofleriaceae bacterium]
MTDLRSLGPSGLDLHLARHGRAASRELDRVCAQIHAHTTLLYWFTDLPAALAEAKRTRRPVLSLRLLGRLDEELSCANSRFFRRLLYPEPRINRVLRDRFVLHWQSVRPVPKVTIDFGDGRTLSRTLTGNSLHVVLDAGGQPIDALPGLVDADTFRAELERALAMAVGGRRRLATNHARAMRLPLAGGPRRRSLDASLLAPTKHVVEGPMLRGVSPAGVDVEADTRANLELHARIHELFARGLEWTADQLVDWIYRELFLMPPDDPALGLDVPEPFTAAPAQFAVIG